MNISYFALYGIVNSKRERTQKSGSILYMICVARSYIITIIFVQLQNYIHTRHYSSP